MSTTSILSIKDLQAKRENLVYMARAAEQAERHADMCKIMKLLVHWEGTTLSSEERNLLSVAYKNEITDRRASCRSLKDSVKEHKSSEWITQYRTVVEKELQVICDEILEILTQTLIPNVKKEADSTDKTDKAYGDLIEAQVFYLKMTGDYHRYLAEIFGSGDCVQKAKETYEKALKLAVANLIPTHPIRLGLALNFSVCYYEILRDKQKACDLAKEAFDAAIAKLDSIDEASYKDSTLIMQLLRDNLTLWQTTETVEDASDEEQS